MATKIDKIKERKAALLEKLKALEKIESKEASDAKKARRQEDNRTKTLLGIATMMMLKELPSPQLIAAIAGHAEKLTAADRKFLATSHLWKELGLPSPGQETTQNGPQATNATQPPQTQGATEKTPPEAFTPAETAKPRVAQVETPLPKASFYEREAVKALGARFNNDEKMWAVPAGMDLNPFQKWL